MASGTDNDNDLEGRIPCDDEVCTGVLDAEGVCGTCDKLGSREAGDPFRTAPPEEPVSCEDDMCTGLIGPDGRCGTCGRRSRVQSPRR
jgi:hypothetical protein